MRFFVWTTREKIPQFSWERTISFLTMEQWVLEAVESFFVFALRSQLLCETNYVTSSLSTLVCDCVGDVGTSRIVNNFNISTDHNNFFASSSFRFLFSTKKRLFDRYLTHKNTLNSGGRFHHRNKQKYRENL